MMCDTQILKAANISKCAEHTHPESNQKVTYPAACNNLVSPPEFQIPNFQTTKVILKDGF